MRLLWASLHGVPKPGVPKHGVPKPGGPKAARTHAESARQHDEILAALRAGDPAAAAAGTYQHIMGSP
jgi:DNA-binding FadR family transcriptional regulator